MRRITIILLLSTISFFNGLAQTKDLEVDRMRITLYDDSTIFRKQEYELIAKRKQVYYISFTMSYLHIKGGKHRTRVKYDKKERKRIFNLVDKLIWTNFQRVDDTALMGKRIVVERFNAEELISSFKVPSELLPPDFKQLLDMITPKE